MDAILSVLLATLLGSLKMLLFVFGPVFVAAVLMFLVSRSIIGIGLGAIGYRALAWVTAPGVVVHELGHALFCLIFLHKIEEISLFKPEPDGTLGYVRHGWNPASMYQRVGNFYIATGPIWFSCLVVWLLSLLLIDTKLFAPLLNLPVGASDLSTAGSAFRLGGRFLENLLAPLGTLFAAERLSDWKFWVFIYLTTAIGLNMSLSPADMKGGLPGFLVLLVAIVIFSLVLSILAAAAPSVGAAAFGSGLLAMLTSISLIFAGGVLLIMAPVVILLVIVGVPVAIIRRRAS